MSVQSSIAEVLRFEIPVSGATYRSVVAALRGPTPPTGESPLFKRPIKASVELDLVSQCYSIASIGSHRLPRAIEIKPSSRTHKNLSGALARSLREQDDHELAALIEGIIALTPSLPADVLHLFRDDIAFQPTAPTASSPRQVKTVEILSIIPPVLLLDLDEAPTLIIPERPEAAIDAAVALLQNSARLGSPLKAKVEGNQIELHAIIKLPRLDGVTVDLFTHWGSYDDLGTGWSDEPIASYTPSYSSNVSFTHTLYVPTTGHYGATLFLRAQGSNTPIWLGRLWSDDARFTVHHDDSSIANERDTLLNETRAVAKNLLALSLETPHTLEEQALNLTQYAPHVGPGALLSEVCSDESSLSDLASVACASHSTSPVAAMFLNYGIGEIVFATPEGPHAAAGGLAQVISGLPPELCRAGIPVTIITPLYRYENGNKHPSAERALRDGILLGDTRVLPTYIGSISVAIGPTYHSGTTTHARSPSTIPLRVYLAQSGNLRVFLLVNASLFDRLYQPVYADEQLRRAIVLSRATLETIATSHFGIRPSAIISNDWMTACVPAFAALDPRYAGVEWLKTSKTIHMIHNGGADYHGRLPTHFYNEDLWPMFNLSPEHYFGFRDPHNSKLLNFSMAAAQHVSGAVLTVSLPYAQQIATPGGGDGIELILQHKRSSVYGISNGVNRSVINRYLSSIASVSEDELGSLDSLIAAKLATMKTIQGEFGLAHNPQARLLSFVGRLAEQKGLSLLSGFVEHGRHSALEDLLINHSDIQILIAGPCTEGDSSSRSLRDALGYLTRKYPGRIATRLDYVPHSKALEIIFGSTFFLMPSRFEPGGITQLEALAAGTLVIGRNVGGISATIHNYSQETATGNGFLFNDYTPNAFANTTHWGLSATSDLSTYRMLVNNARSAEHDWSDRVDAYRAILQRVILGHDRFNTLPWNGSLKAQISRVTIQ